MSRGIDALIGFALGAVLIAAVCASGQTFAQRCHRAFPQDALATERCVYDLEHGERP